MELSTKYKTTHQLAKDLLAGPDVMAVVARPVFDAPGCATALPVKLVYMVIQDKDCMVIAADNGD